MKRSSVITLLVLGSGGVFFYALAGEKRAEGVPEGGKTYTSQAQCESAGDLGKEDCAKSWTEARDAHEAKAPKFTSIADCEKDYGAGNCAAPHAGGTGVFLPAMAAFMIGRAWGAQGYQAAPLLRRPQDQPGQFAFTGGQYSGGPARSGGWFGGGGSSSSRSSSGFGGGGWGRSSSSSSSSASVSTTARGGFGSAGGGFSAGG